MQNFLNFVKYNNVLPISLFLVFGMSGAAFAAPEVREAVYTTKEEIQGVDNSYVISADLNAHNFNFRITEVKEDSEHYYVTYTYSTIAIVEYVWQTTEITKLMTVSKKELTGKDLGLFVAKQLGEELAREFAFLNEAQEKERKAGTSARIVTTTYAGLIGQMLDPTQKEFPTYVPVVDEKVLSPGLAAALAAAGGEPTTQVSLPPIPTESDIQRLIQEALQKALAQNTPPPDRLPQQPHLQSSLLQLRRRLSSLLLQPRPLSQNLNLLLNPSLHLRPLRLLRRAK
jgi:hypothetical protein